MIDHRVDALIMLATSIGDRVAEGDTPRQDENGHYIFNGQFTNEEHFKPVLVQHVK